MFPKVEICKILCPNNRTQTAPKAATSDANNPLCESSFDCFRSHGNPINAGSFARPTGESRAMQLRRVKRVFAETCQCQRFERHVWLCHSLASALPSTLLSPSQILKGRPKLPKSVAPIKPVQIKCLRTCVSRHLSNSGTVQFSSVSRTCWFSYKITQKYFQWSPRRTPRRFQHCTFLDGGES